MIDADSTVVLIVIGAVVLIAFAILLVRLKKGDRR
jgi:hypothetical protein